MIGILRMALNKRDWNLLRAIQETYRQQQEMYDENKHSIAVRFVSIYQPNVRHMPRGKDRATVEFGSKQLVMHKNSYTHVHTISWDNFSEGICLKDCIEYYKEVYNCYPAMYQWISYLVQKKTEATSRNWEYDLLAKLWGDQKQLRSNKKEH